MLYVLKISIIGFFSDYRNHLFIEYFKKYRIKLKITHKPTTQRKLLLVSRHVFDVLLLSRNSDPTYASQVKVSGRILF